MRDKKVVNIKLLTKLEGLSVELQALYWELVLKSNDGGIIKTLKTYDGLMLCRLIDASLIRVAKNQIILTGFLTSNYGPKMKPSNNPLKNVFKCIEDAGFEYNQEISDIDIPKALQTRPTHSLNKVERKLEGVHTRNAEKNALEGSKIIRLISSTNFALYLAILLMIGQSTHTSNMLIDLVHLSKPFNIISSIITAILLDSLIIYFVVTGQVRESFAFFFFCSMANLYSLHLETDYLTYKSLFAIIVSIGIPYGVHSVAKRVKENKTIIIQ